MLFGVSKQAYYKYDDNAALSKSASEEFALQYIRGVRKNHDPGIGGVKLWYMYRQEFKGDNSMGRDRFLRLLDENGLKIRNKVRKPRTTDSTHGQPLYPNLITDFIPTGINQLWVSDITYITIFESATKYHFCYLSLILDAYSEEIVGWSVGPTLDYEYPLEALEMALVRIKDKNVHLIHHSDRGCQYASREYINTLMRYGISVSMTESGNPKDNAKAERINNTIKNELLKGKVFRSIEEVIDAVDLAVDFYNNRRPHMSIDMMTPVQAAATSGERNMRWVSYRERSIKYRNELENSEKDIPLSVKQGLPSGLRPPVNPCQ